VWLVGFSAVYAIKGLSCSRDWPGDLDARFVVLGVAALCVLVQLLVLLAVWYAPSASRFVQTTALALAATALGVAIWTLMPVLSASGCR